MFCAQLWEPEEVPRIKEIPIAIHFLGTYVIVMGVSNLPGNIEMEKFSVVITDVKLVYAPVHHGYIKIHI